MPGFLAHIKDAILLNRERKKTYAALSDGETIALSNTLIFLEQLILPIACYFDWRSKKFNKKGIPIIEEDFLPMHVKSASNLILDKKSISKMELLELRKELAKYIKEIKRREILKKLNTRTILFHRKLKVYQKENRILLPMTLHLIESIYLISKNGLRYAEQSKGQSESLTRDLIRLHLIGLRFALKFDQKASKFNQRGIGIVANDLPSIKIN